MSLLRQVGLLADRGAAMQAGGVRGAHLLPDVCIGYEKPMDSGLWSEVKLGKRPNIRAALRQAQEDCPDDQTPLAWTRADRDEWLITMRAADFARMLEVWLMWQKAEFSADPEIPQT